MTMNINNPKAAEYHWKNVSVYGFDFEIPLSPKGDYLQDQNVPQLNPLKILLKNMKVFQMNFQSGGQGMK